MMKTAEIQTAYGNMKVEFFETDAPNTVKTLQIWLKKDFMMGSLFTGYCPTL